MINFLSKSPQKRWYRRFFFRTQNVYILGLALLLSAHTTRVMWNNNSDKTRFDVHNLVNDWYSNFHWIVYDDQGDFNEWEWETGDNWNSKHLPLFNSSGSYVGNKTGDTWGRMPLGPSVTVTKDIRAEFGSGSDDDNYDNIGFYTRSIIKPDSVWVKSFGISIIDIEWKKGSSIPDENSKYIIKLDGAPLDTVDGDKRNYSIKDLEPNSTYNIELATYTDGGSHDHDGITYATWSRATSPFISVSQQTEDFNMEASDGNFSSRVRVNWSKVSGADVSDFRILRSKLPPNQSEFEELAIINRQSTAHNDYDAIPGFVYAYRLQALNAVGDTLAQITNDGYGKPVGAIQGKIYARGNIGVKGVRVCAKPKNTITPMGSPGLPAAHPDSGFCVSTTLTGRYEIRNLYFFDSASFVVTPYFDDHGFDPGNEEIILDLTTKSVDNINFVDTSAIGVGGRIYFPLAAYFNASGTDTIPLEGATILINSADNGVRTDARGFWKYALTDTGTFRFKATFPDHEISKEGSAIGPDSVILKILDDKKDINFVDLQTDSIDIKAQDACGGPLASGAPISIEIKHEKGINFFQKTLDTDAQGKAKMVLPASQFKVTFGANQPIALGPNKKAQLDTLRFDLDLSKRDTIPFIRIDTLQSFTPADTIIVGNDTIITPPISEAVLDTVIGNRTPQPKTHFIYYAPFDIQIDWSLAGAYLKRACSPTGPNAADSVILLNSTENYLLKIKIFDSEQGCPVDSGKVQIYDFIADKERAPLDIPISKGIAPYEMIAGEPNTFAGGSHPYEKAIFLNVTAGSRKNQPFLYWGLVQGTEELTPTFTTRSPELPDLIVHDPPGDASYAWVEKGSAFTIDESYSAKTEDGANGFSFEAILGGKINTSLGLGSEVEFEIGAGIHISNLTTTGYNSSTILSRAFTYSFEENFSTSDDPIFTGNDGDVYIGKATNQRYSIARVLLYDTTTCIASIQNKANLEQTGIATTFMYAEKHIESILVPQLNFLELSFRRQASRTTDPDEKKRFISEADSFTVDAKNWKMIVANNARQRDSLAVDNKKNVSFSAGAPYETTTSRDTLRYAEIEYIDYMEEENFAGFTAVVDGGVWIELDAGFVTSMRKETVSLINRDTATSFVTGYHLQDDDFGDYFSVDILTDTFYNVPSFRLYGGTSSCPHEEGTQPRDKASITILPPRVDNVSPDEDAFFTASLTNKSESFETREYHVKVISATNPQGALINLGGYDIMNDPVSYFLDTLTYDIVMNVSKGPKAVSYQNIGIMMYPPCEYELWEDNGSITSGDTAWITINYQTECTSVSIEEPNNNWFINDRTSQILTVDFGGYDKDNAYLETLTLEYKRQGSSWADGPQVQATALTGDLYRTSIDFTNLPDGKYWIRARANCNANQGVVYSPELVGIVDRYSRSPFGRGFPQDDFLRKGQQIAVKWDVPIDTSFSNPARYLVAPQVILRRTDNDNDIPFTISWNGDSTTMYLNPVNNIFADPALVGVIFEARVEGVRSGIDPDYDYQVYPVTWSFQVNTSPVFWDPEVVSASMFTGYGVTTSSKLQNITSQLKTFKLTRYPSWLTPSDTIGRILPFNHKNFEFAISSTLAPGTYSDTVVAMVDAIPEYLVVNVTAAPRRPNWAVDEGKHQWAMSMVVAISLDSTNTNLSTDKRDMVGAFFNGQCRGVGTLQYVPQMNKYLAFLPVHLNTPGGERISFRIWDASTGKYYEAKETHIGYSDLVLGMISAPFILHPEHTFQVIPLHKGWNWVSLNVENDDMRVNNLLKSLGSPFPDNYLIGNPVIVKRKDGHSATFLPIVTPYLYSNQWYGPLVELGVEHSYMIFLAWEKDTLWIPGTPVTAQPRIQLYSGWNWPGYPVQDARPIKDAFDNVNLRNRDLARGQDAFSEYHRPSKEWVGSLQMIKPGEGYRLKLKAGKAYGSFQYARYENTDYAVNHTRFESSMTVLGTLDFANQKEIPSDRLVVGAFLEDSCRGTGQLEWLESIEEYRVLFSFHGNPTDIGKVISFKIYDTYTGEEILLEHSQEFFVTDQILGTMNEPYVLGRQMALPEGGYFLEQAYPNPFDQRTNIHFTLPQAEQVSIRVFDQLGKQVAVLVDEARPAGEHTVTFDGSKLPSGIYHYSIQAGDYRASRKMVKF